MKSNVLWPYSSVENSLNLQGCKESLENACQSFEVVNKFRMFCREKSLVLLLHNNTCQLKKKCTEMQARKCLKILPLGSNKLFDSFVRI